MACTQDPYLDAGLVGFIQKFARKNHWRVATWLDLDDLVQEGYLAYYKVQGHPKYAALFRKKSPSADDMRQVTSLVRTTLTRRMHTLSNSLNATPESALGVSLGDLAPATECVNGVRAALAGGPRELVVLASILADDMARAMQFTRTAAWRDRGRLRAGADRRFVYDDVTWLRETTAQRTRRLADFGEFRRGRPGYCSRQSRRVGTRETTNEMFCRLLGLDPRTNDIRGMIRKYLAQ